MNLETAEVFEMAFLYFKFLCAAYPSFVQFLLGLIYLSFSKVMCKRFGRPDHAKNYHHIYKRFDPADFPLFCTCIC